MYSFTRRSVQNRKSALRKNLFARRALETQLFSRAECEAAFDELDCALDGHLAFDGDQDVEVIGHNDEIVEEIVVLVAVRTSMNNFAERWDCNRFRFAAMDEVTKNVRRSATTAAGLE